MRDLPERLLAGAHTSADLALAGVTSEELKGPLWRQVLPQLYAWAATDPHHPRHRALVVASVVPDDGAVGGWAAAYLLGAGQLDGSTPDADIFEPVLVCLQRRSQRPWWPGIRPFRSDLDPSDVVEVEGVRLTSALRTAFDLGRLASSVTEAVVCLDVVVRDLGVRTDELLAYAEERPRWRGVQRLRRAVPLVDPRAKSPQESRFRMLWVLDAGLPRPLCNWPVLDLDGHLLGEVDLLGVAAGLVGEYDGADHSGAYRRSVDHARHDTLLRHRLRVVRTAAPDLGRYRRRTVHRLRTDHALGMARDRSRDLWVPGRP